MAIALDKHFDSGTSTSTTLAVPTGGIAAGCLLVIGVRSGGTQNPTISDARSNTWVKAGGASYNDGSNWGSQWYTIVATPLQAADNITCSVSSTWVAASFTGVDTTTTVDQGVSDSNKSGTFTGTNTATLSGSSDLYVMTAENSNTSATLTDTTTGLTDYASGAGTNGTTSGGTFMRWKILPDTTAVNYAGVQSASTVGMRVQTYLAAAAGASSDTAQNSGSAAPFITVIGATA